MKHAVNTYLHETPSEGAGGAEEFRFTTHGAGDVPVEIYNIKRGGAAVRNKISSYEKVYDLLYFYKGKY
jgi:hypothetical protein